MVSREDVNRDAETDQAETSADAWHQPRFVLTEDERSLLGLLVTGAASKTPAQLAAGTGLSRARVAKALEGLLTKGLVSRYNTLVESYGARFPGVDV